MTERYPVRRMRSTVHASTTAPAAARVTLSAGCCLAGLILLTVRVVTLVIAFSDLFSGRPSHVVVDLLLILLAW